MRGAYEISHERRSIDKLTRLKEKTIRNSEVQKEYLQNFIVASCSDIRKAATVMLKTNLEQVCEELSLAINQYQTVDELEQWSQNLGAELHDRIQVFVTDCETRCELELQTLYRRLLCRIEEYSGIKTESLVQYLDLCIGYMENQNDAENVRPLEMQRENVQKDLFSIVVVGEFSAGKSTFLNALMHRRILPSFTSETTATINFLRHKDQAPEEVAGRVYYADGHTRDLPSLDLDVIEQVVSTRGDDVADKIDHVDLFLESDFLKDGVMMVDSPGLNGMLSKHRQMTEKQIKSSHACIFMFRADQPGSKTEFEFLHELKEQSKNILFVLNRIDRIHSYEKQSVEDVVQSIRSTYHIDVLDALNGRGVPLAFVRTHCDEIHSSEENPEHTISSDQQLLSCHGITPDNCFHVSNLPDSAWYRNIASLKELLLQVGQRSAQELKDTTKMQLATIYESCFNALSERQEILEAEKAGNQAVLQQKQKECAERISHFEDLIAERRHALQGQLQQLDRSIHRIAVKNADDVLDEAVERIAHCGTAVRTSDQMKALMRSGTRKIIERINIDLNQITAPILTGIRIGLQTGSFSLDEEIPAPESLADLENTQDYTRDQLVNRLGALRENRNLLEAHLEKIQDSPKYSDLQHQLQAIEQEIAESQREFDGFPPYQPKMLEVQDGQMKPSQMAKVIGSIADYALLLIPGATVANVFKSVVPLKNVAKGIGVFEKTSKIISTGLSNMITKGDSVKDIAYALRGMSKTYATQARLAKANTVINTAVNGIDAAWQTSRSAASTKNGAENPGFLDFLTIEYWAEQIGKKFDAPPKLAIDKEYEQQYYEAKSQIEHKLRDQQYQAYQLRQKYNSFANEQERLQAERNATLVDEKRVEEELHHRIQEIHATAERQAYQQWKQSCAEWFRSRIAGQIKPFFEASLSNISVRLQEYQEERIGVIRAKLETEQKNYAALQESSCDAADHLERVTARINELKEAFAQ